MPPSIKPSLKKRKTMTDVTAAATMRKRAMGAAAAGVANAIATMKMKPKTTRKARENDMERTDYNGELRLKDVGKAVKLVGWVSTKRNLGAIEFIDLRDNTGIVQLTIQDSSQVADVRNEYVIAVEGTVAKKATPNPKLPS